MKCSKLNYHLFLLHVIESPLCICGGGNEDAPHYLLNCPFHLDARRLMLREISQLINNITVNVLLHGSDTLDLDQNKKLFDAVHNFISTTKRLD
jgi:hypothetical protein